MATIGLCTPDVDGSAFGGVDGALAAASADGDTFANDGTQILTVRNESDDPIVVTVVTWQIATDGLAVANLRSEVDAHAEWVWPYLNPALYNDQAGLVHVRYSAVDDVTVGVTVATPLRPTVARQAPLREVAATLPAQVLNLAAAVTLDEEDAEVPGSVTLTWRNPPSPANGSLFDGVRILRIEGDDPIPEMAEDGTAVEGEIIATLDGFPSEAGEYVDDTAEGGTLYTYGVFTRGADGSWSTVGTFVEGTAAGGLPDIRFQNFTWTDAGNALDGDYPTAGEAQAVGDPAISNDSTMRLRIYRLPGTTQPEIDETGASTNGATLAAAHDVSGSSPGDSDSLTDNTATAGTWTWGAFLAFAYDPSFPGDGDADPIVWNTNGVFVTGVASD